MGFTNHEVIGNYHAHRESEQFHSEFKAGMDLERLPSGKLATKRACIGTCGDSIQSPAYDWSAVAGLQKPRLKKTIERRRLRIVIGSLVNMTYHVTKYARQLVIGLVRSNVLYIFLPILEYREQQNDQALFFMLFF